MPTSAGSDRNRAIFEDVGIVHAFDAFEGWLDAGERRSLVEVAPFARGEPVLDLGVGLGRTASFLRILTDDYTAVDYSEPMVRACRARFPDLDVRHLDARRLDGLADDRFALVFFSNNGIDAVDRDGRAAVLAECRRVTRPGGLILVTTLNIDGVAFGETPWQIHRPHRAVARSPRPFFRSIIDVASNPARKLEAWSNYLRRERNLASGEGWAFGYLVAHEFRLAVHFTSLSRLRADIESAGLELVCVRSSDDGRVVGGERSEGTDYFYALARKRG